MRIFTHIVATLTIALLVVSTGIGDSCSVLCYEAFSQAEHERYDCACISTHASARRAAKHIPTQLKNHSSENCDLCVEIPVCIEDERLPLVKTPEVKNFPLSLATYLDSIYSHSSLTTPSKASIWRTSWLNMGSLPLRI